MEGSLTLWILRSYVYQLQLLLATCSAAAHGCRPTSHFWHTSLCCHKDFYVFGSSKSQQTSKLVEEIVEGNQSYCVHGFLCDGLRRQHQRGITTVNASILHVFTNCMADHLRHKTSLLWMPVFPKCSQTAWQITCHTKHRCCGCQCSLSVHKLHGRSPATQNIAAVDASVP